MPIFSIVILLKNEKNLPQNKNWSKVISFYDPNLLQLQIAMLIDNQRFAKKLDIYIYKGKTLGYIHSQNNHLVQGSNVLKGLGFITFKTWLTYFD